MTSHELARQLLEGDDIPVVMSKDPEGNFFRPFVEIGDGYYWAGDIYLSDDPLDEEGHAGATRSIVLWP